MHKTKSMIKNRYFFSPLSVILILLMISNLFLNCENLSLKPQNNAPNILSLTADKTSLKPGETIQIKVTAEDPDGDDLSYSWTVSSGRILNGYNTATIQYQAPTSVTGSISITATVSDDDESVSRQLVLTIIQNMAPIIKSLIPDFYQIDPGDTISIQAIVEDEDTTSLTYEWSAQRGEFLPPTNQNRVLFVAPVTGGALQIELKVTDDQGLSRTKTINISIRSFSEPTVQITYPMTGKYYVQHDTAHVKIKAFHDNGLTVVNLYINGILKETQSGSSISNEYLFTPALSEPGGTAYLVAYATAQTTGTVGVDSVAILIEGVVLGKPGE